MAYVYQEPWLHIAIVTFCISGKPFTKRFLRYKREKGYLRVSCFAVSYNKRSIEFRFLYFLLELYWLRDRKE